jgi:hypothetical protein
MLSVRRLPTFVLISLVCLFAACGGDDDSAGNAGTSSGAEAGKAAAAGHSGSSGNAAGNGHSGAGGKLAEAGHSGSTGSAAAGGHSGSSGSVASGGHSGSAAGAGGSSSHYGGPSVGTAQQFAVLAYNSVTTANTSTLVGTIGVSAAAVSVVTGFDDPQFIKYGNDALAPNDHLTGNAQGDVTKLVGDIDPRMCDRDLTDVVGGLTGDITLHPGVTCMNSFSADVLVNGHVYLDAGGDDNAFFIIRGNKTLTVADGAQVVLTNGAHTCGVFWRISEAVTIGKTVAFEGTVIAGTAITMKTASTLNGRALAQTAGVQLDANTVKAPTNAECPHVQ